MISFQRRVLSIRKNMYRHALALSRITSARLMSTQDIKWLWEANDYIQDYHRANIAGTRIGSFTATLNSSKSLEEDDIRKSLSILMKQNQNLRACLQFRAGKLWYCLPSNLKLDFKVMKKGTTSREAFVSATENRFQVPDTAQWAFRLFPESEETECPIPAVRGTHPFQYGIVFTGHHGIMDGLGASFIITRFINILNDVIEGKPLDDDEYLPYHEEKQLPALFDQMEKKLREDPCLLETVNNRLPPPNHVPLFLQAFPPPEVTEVTTKYVSGILEPKIFNMFMSKAKKKGVTFNSALLSVGNVAAMELFKERGIVLDKYQIASIVTITLRRYMKPSSTFFFGPGTGHMTYVSSLDSSVRNNFWNYCQSVNKDLHTLFRQGAPLQEKCLQRLLSSGEPPLEYLTRVKPPIHDHSFNNLGDLSHLISEDKKYVKVTSILSRNMMHNTFHITFHEVFSARGTNYYTLSYATDLVSDATANLLLERIFAVLKEVSHL